MFFPLHPETPAQGRSLETLFAGRGVDLDGMHQRMRALMEDEGLPYARRTHTYNSRLAQELAKWAETQPGGRAIHDRVYRAYFVDGHNIGDVRVLVALAESIGLAGDQARAALEARAFKDTVDADWALSSRSRVTAVPTFMMGGNQVVGAQPETVLRRLVEAAGVPSRLTAR